VQEFSNPIATPVAPPSWVQLGVLVLDGSTSMTWQLEEQSDEVSELLPPLKKGEAVEVALKGLFNRLKSGNRAANFQFGLVTYNDKVTEERAPRPLLELTLSESFDPTARGTGGTHTALGLDAAGRMAEAFLDQHVRSDLPVSVVVLLMSDGEDADPAATLAAATRVRELPNTEVAACLFATKGKPPVGDRLLRALVSAPRLYETVYTPEQLRSFFQASLTVTAPARIAGLLTSGE
jgi:uncharacterized protein YegL